MKFIYTIKTLYNMLNLHNLKQSQGLIHMKEFERHEHERSEKVKSHDVKAAEKPKDKNKKPKK